VQSICQTCNVGLHDRCIALAGGNCVCNAEAHEIQRHPDLQRGLYRKDEYSPRSYVQAVRDIDYELEPHRQRRPNETKANKSRPVDDLEDARQQAIDQANRYVRF
jgi:hypothetical protein